MALYIISHFDGTQYTGSHSLIKRGLVWLFSCFWNFLQFWDGGWKGPCRCYQDDEYCCQSLPVKQVPSSTSKTWALVMQSSFLNLPCVFIFFSKYLKIILSVYYGLIIWQFLWVNKLKSFLDWLFNFRVNESMYHALGYSTIMYLQAMMTFEPVCKD